VTKGQLITQCTIVTNTITTHGLYSTSHPLVSGWDTCIRRNWN